MKKVTTKTVRYLILALALLMGLLFTFKNINVNPHLSVGQRIDSLHGVYVYYNGGVSHTGGRDTTADGYNIGMRYQCVEFVKRYYYEHYEHKMPDSYGNAKDFFDKKLSDGQWNAKRALLQFTNPSQGAPQQGDLLVYSPTIWNRYGHVAIIAAVGKGQLEIIQQNPGPFASSRETYTLKNEGNTWIIDNDRVVGWLRMPQKDSTDTQP